MKKIMLFTKKFFDLSNIKKVMVASVHTQYSPPAASAHTQYTPKQLRRILSTCPSSFFFLDQKKLFIQL